jgi:hypothetical protein
VSAFAPMPVPDDLQLEIDQPDQGSR